MMLKKSTLYLALTLFLIIVAGAFVFSNNSKSATLNNSNANQQSDSEVQKVVLSYKNYNYYPNTVTVKVNQLVEISLDGSVRGCYRLFGIPALDLQKNLRTPQDTLTFTPTQKGAYTFTCSMGMGKGTLVVE